MAEYSISTEDDERSDDPTTSTPLSESTYVRRRKRRLEKYLAGTRRAPVHIDIHLHRSLSSNESSVLSKQDIPADMAVKGHRRELRNVAEGALQYCDCIIHVYLLHDA